MITDTRISEVYNEDCMIGMARYPDKYFDLAVVDPPYGIGEDAAKAATRVRTSKKWVNPSAPKYTGVGWDKSPMNKEYFIELKRVSKHQIIWGANHFIENIPSANSSSWLVWYKTGQTPGCDFADCELAYSSHKKAVRYFRFDWVGFGAVNAKESRIHPTQKPVALYDWIYKNYLPQGGKVIDTHLGSGSNRIAANKAGNIDFVGFELDKNYYEAQEKRWKAFISQTRLF